MTRGSLRLAAALGATVLIAACELGTITVPRTAAGIVVHGVLNPSATTQVILLERSLSGSATIKTTPFDATDPIVSGGGIPISGAAVDIIDSTGKTTRAVEDLASLKNGKGAGVYRIAIAGASLVLGARYQLRIHTAQGEDASASTRLPRADVRLNGGLTRTLNRDHDTMYVQWAAARSARAYGVRIESPFGPFFLFTDSTHVGLTGSLRNLFASDLQRVFVPGFRQDMLVAAVDSNYYDYYRTTNDPFTGSGIISRVAGGVGVFGSIVSLNNGTLTVTADQTQPIAGRFRAIIPPPGNPAPFLSQVVLYVESPAAKEGFPSSLSGRYTTTAPNARSDGVLGEQFGSFVTLVLLTNQLAVDTLDVFTGQLHGDTLTGSYRVNVGSTVFVRSP